MIILNTINIKSWLKNFTYTHFVGEQLLNTISQLKCCLRQLSGRKSITKIKRRVSSNKKELIKLHSLQNEDIQKIL